MANFKPSERSKRATLGPRKGNAQMLKQLLGSSITNVVCVDNSSGEESNAEVRDRPLIRLDYMG